MRKSGTLWSVRQTTTSLCYLCRTKGFKWDTGGAECVNGRSNSGTGKGRKHVNTVRVVVIRRTGAGARLVCSCISRDPVRCVYRLESRFARVKEDDTDVYLCVRRRRQHCESEWCQLGQLVLF